MFAWGGRNWILGTLFFASVSLLIYALTFFYLTLMISIMFLILELFFLSFFRDPPRWINSGIVSPADGRIISIESFRNKKENGKFVRIAIFMSVFNVHVNRAPISGKVLHMVHKSGGIIPAYEPGSKKNERLITYMNTPIGGIKIIQIAGLLAKRIVPYIRPKQYLSKGQRIGIIQFGSRVDLILPNDKVKILITKGQNVKAGMTTVANIKNV
jgi:phosphatidylserine decarboxylase